LLYGRIASGYRPGGPERPVPGGPPGLPTEFASDSTVNYEVGLKGAFLDKTVTADVSVFYIDWTGIQINEVIPVGGLTYSITGNAGTAVSKGLEWSIDWSPVAGLTVGTAGAYTDAYLSASAPGIGGLKGDALPYVPDVSANLHFDYEWHYGAFTPFVGGVFSYIGDRYSDFSTSAPFDHKKIPDYTTLALNAGVKKGPYTFEIYGKNLGDSRGVTYYSPFGADVTGANGTAVLIRPLTIGVRLAASF
jgi:outer membrane receptor protein involved in Fe transport